MNVTERHQGGMRWKQCIQQAVHLDLEIDWSIITVLSRLQSFSGLFPKSARNFSYPTLEVTSISDRRSSHIYHNRFSFISVRHFTYAFLRLSTNTLALSSIPPREKSPNVSTIRAKSPWEDFEGTMYHLSKYSGWLSFSVYENGISIVLLCPGSTPQAMLYSAFLAPTDPLDSHIRVKPTFVR